jgi:hypothetical protein
MHVEACSEKLKYEMVRATVRARTDGRQSILSMNIGKDRLQKLEIDLDEGIQAGAIQSLGMSHLNSNVGSHP